MNNVVVSFELAHPASRVWELVGNPATIASWHPAIERSPMKDGLRTCVLRDGAVIRERIDEEDASARSYRYSIVESPLPLSNYRSTLQVKESGAARSTVEWSGSFESDPAAAPALVEMLRGIYVAGLAAVRERLG